MIKGFVIAGTKSGSGKTLLTLGLLSSFMRRGYRVVSFKVGPDFIDPGHHAVITQRESRNLDGWMLPKPYNMTIFKRNVADADMVVVEGVMGLYDGYDGKSDAGSTAQMAKWLGLPVILVVDVKSMARSAAAIVQGFEGFDPGVRFAGVVLNHVAGQRHFAYIEQALSAHVRMPCFGGLPNTTALSIPERHLGLVTASDYALDGEQQRRLADFVDTHIDIDRLIHGLPRMDAESPIRGTEKEKPVPSVRIGVSMDRAFCFHYPDNLELLENEGAEIVFFSPLTDRRLPENMDGLYFIGGYPELHAKKLAGNTDIRGSILEKSREGMPIYSECGGFMYLCSRLEDANGNRFPMVGCFPFRTKMDTRLRSLGYREVSFTGSSLLGKKGNGARGHEFHYSFIASDSGDHTNIDLIYRVTDRAGHSKPSDGYQVRRTVGSYIHLHFGSRPEIAGNFIHTCLAYQKERASVYAAADD
jgi:cobyrinic acid a,c-diamide synthase